MGAFYFSYFFSFRGNLLECSSVHAVTSYPHHLCECLCGFGVVAWLRSRDIAKGLRLIGTQGGYVLCAQE